MPVELKAPGHFNPLPPHGGRRCTRPRRSCSPIFQSTPSAWRETQDQGTGKRGTEISIHSLRMEGDDRKTVVFLPLVISIHSLRMEGDRSEAAMARPTTEFQSTPSAWRETSLSRLEIYRQSNFNPLPPHGGRPPTERDDKRRLAISIHSLRMEGDIKRYLITVRRMEISIHSLRMEGDFRSWHCVDRTDISIHSLRMEGD